jgi:spore coat polysaccharide biosynthesis predicted glycosyltransferase SpsG
LTKGATPVPPILEIAVDGGPSYGYGHVGRCLALWEALDGEAFFSVSDPSIDRFLRHRGAVTRDALDAPDVPVALLDRVEPTSAGEVLRLQAAGRRVVLLDDRGDGREVADLVVDPPTAAAWPPAGGRRLDGFEHVLLRREVLEAKRAGAPESVLLALGGSDPGGMTPVLATALASTGASLAVNLGPGYGGNRDVPGRVLESPDDFVGELAGARLFVSAYGHSLLEAAHLGVPAVIAVTRPEHSEHAAAFAAEGSAELVDMSGGARPEELVQVVSALVADPSRLDALSERGRILVDGGGAKRVAQAIRSLAV